MTTQRKSWTAQYLVPFVSIGAAVVVAFVTVQVNVAEVQVKLNELGSRLVEHKTTDAHGHRMPSRLATLEAQVAGMQRIDRDLHEHKGIAAHGTVAAQLAALRATLDALRRRIDRMERLQKTERTGRPFTP